MTLYIHGIASRTSLHASDPHCNRIEEMEDLEDLPKPMRRKMGRLAKLMFSAVSEITGPGELPAEFPLVIGTAYGEVEMGLTVLQDIYESEGELLRPIKVQNSVHVSISGYLGILLQNQGPTLTVSQGRLTAEASILALESMLQEGIYEKGVVVIGDIYDPQWARTLGEKAPRFQQLLEENPPDEGVVAVVLGRNKPLDGRYDDLTMSAMTVHLPEGCSEYGAVMAKILPSESKGLDIIIRNIRGQQDYDYSQLSSGKVSLFPDFYTRSLGGPLTFIADTISGATMQKMVIISREDDDLGCITLGKTPK